MSTAIEKVAVVGTGLMGTGIALCCAAAGMRVTLIKATGGDTGPVLARLRRSLERQVERGKLTPEARDRTLGNIEVTGALDALQGASFVIESGAENIAAKQALLAAIESSASPGAVIGSNTSSLRLSTLGEVLKRPDRFLGLHFFSPAEVMKLVEIGPTARTSPAAVGLAEALCQRIGKTPVTVGDHPGYLVNRLLVPYILHAIETLEQGVAGPEAIDTAMRLGAGHPLGPLALADLIGLDVVFAMSRSLHQELRDGRYRCPSLLRRLVLGGHLGKKTGKGLYVYGTDGAKPNPALFAFAEPSSPAAHSAA